MAGDLNITVCYTCNHFYNLKCSEQPYSMSSSIMISCLNLDFILQISETLFHYRFMSSVTWPISDLRAWCPAQHKAQKEYFWHKYLCSCHSFHQPLMMQTSRVSEMLHMNSIFTGIITKSSWWWWWWLYKNEVFLFPTTDLKENTKTYYKIYPVLLCSMHGCQM